ncbi:calcineurin-like phosphoesterase family protein [Roseiarcus fermentans]|uniref:Calcineurin-like phosphoesterase family protein n=1 Tax=Roseiarcus fermentans TaxID=1473586 RepID=A0A366FBG1_9HYPH|nr:calcineurin-like phosphoesterase family protein [Roseiarcus fermentans]RBP11971.1 calcineurin-like phosphoesterase family protein [Roseiarcus fermentans]
MADHIELTRREALLAAAGSLALAAVDAAPALAQAAATVSGVVFEDRDGSSAAGPGNPGLAGVLVSNGRDVAVTGPDGRYALPLPDEATIFVVKPAGYGPPLDPATNLPRFYRHHRPIGSPASLGLLFEGIAPTGPLPASLDFALKRQDEPKAFDVVLITDPQPENEAEVDFIREDLIQALSGTNAQFGLTAGDVMFDDLSLYPRLNAIIGTIGLPWWNIGGNHDLNFEAPDRTYSRETFKRVYGPNYYAFFYGQTLFLMLDNVDYLGPDPTKPRGSGKYEGRFDAAQLDFVRDLLAHTPPETLIVAVMHIPLRTFLGTEAYQNTANMAAFFALLEGRKHTVSFSGHTHTTEHHYFGKDDGWSGETPHHQHVLTALSGSWWSGPFDHRGVASADSRDGTPNGFHILSIDGSDYSTRFVPAKEPNGRQMRLSVLSRFHGIAKETDRAFRQEQLLGSPVARAALGASTLVANVFDAGEKTNVTMRIGDRPPVAMKRELRPDPFVEEVFSRNEATRKAWVKADPSSHLWTARLPADLAPGAWRVDVEAVNEYGKTVTGRLALEVT